MAENKTSGRQTTANAMVASRLREAADLLEQQSANPFRVRAYRQAADTVAGLGRDIADVLREGGREALVALPHIGQSLAAAIAEMVDSGRWMQLERLRGTSTPEKLFQAVPGVGPKLARLLHDELHVDTLEALEAAAHDGRLEQIQGIGSRRASILRATLGEMLQRRRPRARRPMAEPDVATLLDVDQEYRERAGRNELAKIAPRRFNPNAERWLPILHTERDDWHFTALFSNTARAHEFDRVRDWVVIYFQQNDEEEGQRTVVTETRGTLTGRRVVRGREAECRAVYV
jgi:putative hydrolase